MKTYGSIYKQNIYNTRMYKNNTKIYKSNSENLCPICYLPLKNKYTLIRHLNCNHCFHIDCIDKWTYSNNTCPECRKLII